MAERAAHPPVLHETPSRRRSADAVAGHIAGLDGVRAFAVIAVVAFHLWPDLVPGGFLGVDVFFVISGFLITTLLVREGDRSGRIDFVGFWRRRSRRLLPALLLVVVTSIVVARLVSADLLVGIDRQTIGALTFSSNWLEIGAGADYFNETSPVLFATFWSLAVEEQFYLFWPVALVAIFALAKTTGLRVRVALGLAFVSAVLMAIRFVPGSNPTRVYYGTDTHLFGLMIGVAVALAFAGGVGIVAQHRWTRLREWIGFTALGGLVVMVLTVDSDSTFTYRGGILLASVLSAVVVASLPGSATSFTRLHGLGPLPWIGERSYGIYLWHWPVILIAAEIAPAVAPGSPPALTTVVACLIITFALSAASYRWVEMPIRTHGLAHVREALGHFRFGWLLTASLLVVAGVAVVSAPDKSEAQLSVERGERAMEAQSQAPAEQPAPTSPPDAAGPAGSPAWPAGLAEPTGDLMIGFGDSVLSGAAPAMYERFPGIVLDAEPIRQWREAPGAVGAAIDAGTIRSAVVLSFGTNAGLVSEESQQALRTVLDDLGPSRRVVLVNTVGVSDWVPSTNATLAAISAEHPNTIVADWHSVVAADPSLLHTDRTHPNLDGIAVYADLVAVSFRDLGPGP
ncbi:MAG TPA: acyltransferase family protein [Acidimicrobiales bacterium]|nr:acyltransferase family protein [Acidimicrobiales bacterium]